MFNFFNKIINDKSKIFFIAEIGINHNGSIEKAVKMIDYAIKADCSAVKFQTFDLKNMLLRNTNLADYQKKDSNKSMFEMLEKYNLKPDNFILLKNYCKKKKIKFLSTPFDLESLYFLNKIGVSAFKVSSGDLDNYMLLDEIKKTKKPFIISTGMSEEREINNTLNHLNCAKNKLAVLHCISDYPTKLKDTNFGFFKKLKQNLKYEIGFSDHTIGENASLVATSLGANIIEKHITLDNNLPGPDHSASLNVKYLKSFVNKINDIKQSINSTKKQITKLEKKTLIVAKKSIYYKKNLEKNSIIKQKDIIALRPKGKGLSPSQYKSVLNKSLKRSVKKFTPIKIKDFK